MYKKGLFAVLVLICAIFVLAYPNFAKNDQGAITQGELAQMVGEKMGLEVPEGSGANEYISALDQRGIRPSDGWNPGKPVTNADLDNIFVGAGRLQAEVDSGKNPKAVLKEVGVVLPSEINKTTLGKALEEPSVKRLLEAPLMAGPSVPYPTKEAEEIKAPETKETPLAETPPPPKAPVDARPSGGGGG